MKHYIAILVQTTEDAQTRTGGLRQVKDHAWLEYNFEGLDEDGKIRALIGEDITAELKRQEATDGVRDSGT